MKIRNLILGSTPIISFDQNEKFDPRKLSKILKIDRGIIETWNNWVCIGTNYYYYKNFPNYTNQCANFINELIGEFLANYVELDSINYSIGCRQLQDGTKDYGLLSKSFRDTKHKYLSPYDMLLSPNQVNLNNIEEIRTECKNDKNYRRLVSQILKMLAIDIYMNQKDRTRNNFLFMKSHGILELAPLYDYEKAFFVDKGFNDEKNPNYQGYLFGLDKNLFHEVEKRPELKELLNIFFSLDINDILDKISDDYQITIPDTLRKDYQEYTKKRKKIIMKEIN